MYYLLAHLITLCDNEYGYLEILPDIREKLVALFPELKTFSDAAEKEGIGFYIVGGALRDVLLGIDPKDIDFVPEVHETARAMAELFVKCVGGTLVEFQSHGDIFRVVYKGRNFDFTELQGPDLEADLKRRDFTINSLALCLEETVDYCSHPLQIIDPMGGIDDIEAKLVRVNSPGVFDDDPLRILRLFRIAFKLGFEMDSFSYRLIPQKISNLERVSPERVRDELMELMHVTGTATALEAMEGVGLLTWLFPALAVTKGFPQNDYHHLDVFSHTLAVIKEFENPELFEDPRLKPFEERTIGHLRSTFPSGRTRLSLIKFAMLMHDIGKPDSATYDEKGRLHFIGHEKVSADLAKEYLLGLRFSKREMNYMLQLIDGHMKPGQIHLESGNLHKQIYRYFRDFGETGVDLAIFSLADRLAARGPIVTKEMIDAEYDICVKLIDTYFNRAQLIKRPPKLISGRTIIDDLGVEPGPRVGILLNRIEEAQVDGHVTDVESAIAFAKELIEAYNSKHPHRTD